MTEGDTGPDKGPCDQGRAVSSSREQWEDLQGLHSEPIGWAVRTEGRSVGQGELQGG